MESMVTQIELPAAVDVLAGVLGGSLGVTAVVVGGSRATGDADRHSDWDLGVYYRGDVDLEPLASFGEVHSPGSWGRIMNGGAWLVVDGTRVDVLLLEIDFVEQGSSEARLGRYQVDGLLGYIAGIPTYSLMAEVAGAHIIHGSLDIDSSFPPALRESAPSRWRFHRDFSLTYAAAQAKRGNVAGALGQCGRAVFEEAHARRCEQARWALNEKRLLDGCQLEGVSEWLADFGLTSQQQLVSIDRIAEVLRASGRE